MSDMKQIQAHYITDSHGKEWLYVHNIPPIGHAFAVVLVKDCPLDHIPITAVWEGEN